MQPEKYRSNFVEKDSYTLHLESKIQDLEARLRLHEATEYQFSRFSALRSSSTVNQQYTAGKPNDNAPGADKASESDPLIAISERIEAEKNTECSTIRSLHTAFEQRSSKPPAFPEQPTDCCSTNGALVSILNSDSSTNMPASFSVVSSLLKETFLEKAKGSSRSPSSSDPSFIPDVSQTIPENGHTSEPSTKALPTTVPHNGPKPLSDKVDGDSYLLPLDLDLSEFFVFDIASPPDDDLGQKVIDFIRLKNHMRFPILRRKDFPDLHKRRFDTPKDPYDDDWNYDQFFLYMTYALCTLSFIGISNTKHFINRATLDPYSFYHRAIIHARKCKNANPILQIQCLCMCTFFQIRQDVGRGLHWNMIDKAMNIARKHKLHKRTSLEGRSVLDQELHLRAFWSLYQLDRLLAFERGVPYVITESEIDIPLFANVNDSEDDVEVILEARKQTAAETISANNLTSLTLSLHGLRITCIEAEIIDTIYCEDKTIQEQFTYVESFLNQLDEWKLNVPKQLGHSQVMIEMFHGRGVRLLLQPFIGFMDPTSPLFIRCMRQTGQIAQGATEISRIIKGYNLISANMLFLSGLTLIYGLWLASKSSLNYQFIIEDIRLCTCSLYALAERSSMFNHYRDTIDNLASATIRHVAELQQFESRLTNVPDVSQKTKVPDEASSNTSPVVEKQSEGDLTDYSKSYASSPQYPIPAEAIKIVDNDAVLSNSLKEMQFSSDKNHSELFKFQKDIQDKLKKTFEKNQLQKVLKRKEEWSKFHDMEFDEFQRENEAKRRKWEETNKARKESLPPTSSNASSISTISRYSSYSPSVPQSYSSSSAPRTGSLPLSVDNDLPVSSDTTSKLISASDDNVNFIPLDSQNASDQLTSRPSLSNQPFEPNLSQPSYLSLGQNSQLRGVSSSFQKVSPLSNRFGSSGSSISWWKNLENQVKENNDKWIHSLGSHDGVTDWIQDLSNFAKQRLNVGAPNSFLPSEQTASMGVNFMDSGGNPVNGEDVSPALYNFPASVPNDPNGGCKSATAMNSNGLLDLGTTERYDFGMGMPQDSNLHECLVPPNEPSSSTLPTQAGILPYTPGPCRNSGSPSGIPIDRQPFSDLAPIEKADLQINDTAGGRPDSSTIAASSFNNFKGMAPFGSSTVRTGPKIPGGRSLHGRLGITRSEGPRGQMNMPLPADFSAPRETSGLPMETGIEPGSGSQVYDVASASNADAIGTGDGNSLAGMNGVTSQNAIQAQPSGQDADVHPYWNWDLNWSDFNDLITWSI